MGWFLHQEVFLQTGTCKQQGGPHGKHLFGFSLLQGPILQTRQKCICFDRVKIWKTNLLNMLNGQQLTYCFPTVSTSTFMKVSFHFCLTWNMHFSTSPKLSGNQMDQAAYFLSCPIFTNACVSWDGACPPQRGFWIDKHQHQQKSVN
jgi:hypothetical protein